MKVHTVSPQQLCMLYIEPLENVCNPEYETRQTIGVDQNVRLTTGSLSRTPRKTLAECTMYTSPVHHPKR